MYGMIFTLIHSLTCLPIENKEHLPLDSNINTQAIDINTLEPNDQAVIKHFLEFIHAFTNLISHEVQDGAHSFIETIEQTLTSLVETALKIIHSQNLSSNATPQEIKKSLEHMNPALAQALTQTITKQARSSALRKQPHPSQGGKPDETTQTILNNVASMFQSFVNIVNNPDDSKNVAHSVQEMVNGVVNIGVEVIHKGLPIDADDQTVQKFIQSLDISLKQKISRAIQRYQSKTSIG